jgi:hypothetical protein
MSDPQDTPATATLRPGRPVKFIHQKAPGFRDYHADGAWTVHSGHGLAHVHFFVEHPRLAEAVISQVTSDGKLFTGQNEVFGAGESDPNHFVVTRDVQCNVVMSLAAARFLREQLDNFIKANEPSSQSPPGNPLISKKQ